MSEEKVVVDVTRNAVYPDMVRVIVELAPGLEGQNLHVDKEELTKIVGKWLDGEEVPCAMFLWGLNVRVFGLEESKGDGGLMQRMEKELYNLQCKIVEQNQLIRDLIEVMTPLQHQKITESGVSANLPKSSKREVLERLSNLLIGREERKKAMEEASKKVAGEVEKVVQGSIPCPDSIWDKGVKPLDFPLPVAHQEFEFTAKRLNEEGKEGAKLRPWKEGGKVSHITINPNGDKVYKTATLPKEEWIGDTPVTHLTHEEGLRVQDLFDAPLEKLVELQQFLDKVPGCAFLPKGFTRRDLVALIDRKKLEKEKEMFGEAQISCDFKGDEPVVREGPYKSDLEAWREHYRITEMEKKIREKSDG